MLFWHPCLSSPNITTRPWVEITLLFLFVLLLHFWTVMLWLFFRTTILKLCYSFSLAISSPLFLPLSCSCGRSGSLASNPGSSGAKRRSTLLLPFLMLLYMFLFLMASYLHIYLRLHLAFNLGHRYYRTVFPRGRQFSPPGVAEQTGGANCQPTPHSWHCATPWLFSWQSARRAWKELASGSTPAMQLLFLLKWLLKPL